MKKSFVFSVFLCLALVLTGCGTQYPDTNGTEDFTLQTVTDQNIVSLDIGASGLGYSERNLGGITSTEYSSDNFNGVEQLYVTSFLLPSDVSLYIGHMQVTRGNFKLAVVHNGRIIFEVPPDAFGETYYFEDLSGEFSVHVAGESAEFTFHMHIE